MLSEHRKSSVGIIGFSLIVNDYGIILSNVQLFHFGHEMFVTDSILLGVGKNVEIKEHGIGDPQINVTLSLTFLTYIQDSKIRIFLCNKLRQLMSLNEYPRTKEYSPEFLI